MIWVRLTNFLFGWQWVWVKLGDSHYAERVHLRPADNRPFVRFCGETLFLDENRRDITPITFTEDQMPVEAARDK